MDQVTIKELLDACRGPRTRRELAKQLGLSERFLHAVYHGQREAGLKILRSIYREFPQYKDLVVSFFLSRMEHDNAQRAQ